MAEKYFHDLGGPKQPSFKEAAKDNLKHMKAKTKEAKSKALAKKKKSGWEQKGGINEHGGYCNHCASNAHKTHEHAALVKAGKISR